MAYGDAYPPLPLFRVHGLHPFRYSAGIRALLPQLLKKEAQARPSTNVILQNPLIKNRIRRLLTEEQVQ